MTMFQLSDSDGSRMTVAQLAHAEHGHAGWSWSVASWFTLAGDGDGKLATAVASLRWYLDTASGEWNARRRPSMAQAELTAIVMVMHHDPRMNLLDIGFAMVFLDARVPSSGWPCSGQVSERTRHAPGPRTR